MNPRFAAAAQAVAELWRGEFGKVMEAMADVHPDLELQSGENGPPAVELLWWKQAFDLADGAVLWVGVEEAAWMQLGQQILTAAGIETVAVQEARSTFLEVLRQSLGGLAMALGAQVGREVAAKDGAEEEPAYGAAEEFRFSLRTGGASLPEVHFWIGAALLEAIARRSDAKPEAHIVEPADVPGVEVPPQHSTLDMLLDVEMPVSVSFGRTQLRLQDVLKLIHGSIIELDRTIAEPVQVVVNNCVIASGEVVVVDGNYGVRIQEITSRRERLEQSRRFMLPTHRNHPEAEAS